MRWTRPLCMLLLTATMIAAAETQEVALPAGGSLAIPADWVAEEGGRMRAAQYKVPGTGAADAEFVVYYFGPQGAGDADANVERWLKQFEADGREDERTSGEGEHGQWHLLQVTGTWNKPIGPPMAGRSEAVPGSAMLAAILPGPKGPYYLKLTGPRELVLAQRPAVEAMLD